ncbi:MAG: DUF3644 domain-containing protein [Defluviitaleaceae bacterium]|nr:DUF3644 domain-containing protein [Defluviitaleaceae bacterium]
MSLELINKPTIKYRTEGFCFFICNAWELALKAFIIKRANNIEAINFKHKPSQTLGLSECIDKVFTSTTNNTKHNLNFIREIRNKATHNILPDYDFKFAPLFQRCITNLNEFIKKYFPEYKVNNQVTAFVALSKLPDGNNSPLTLNSSALSQLLDIEKSLFGQDVSGDITQTFMFKSTKKASEADIVYSIDKDSNDKVKFIDVPKDVDKTHPYIASEIVKRIKESLKMTYGSDFGFNMHNFSKEFCPQEKIKEQPKYYNAVTYGNSKGQKYSDALLEYAIYYYGQKYCNKKD